MLDAYDAFTHQIAALHAPEVAELHLTLAQLKTLYLVAAVGPIPMGALARQLGTALSTTSGGVDRLVQLELLERVEDPEDRRQVLVRATPTAIGRLEEMRELSHGRMRELLMHLPSLADVEAVERAIRLLGDASRAMAQEAHS